MNKAYKFRIYPNKEQKIMFAKTFYRKAQKRLSKQQRMLSLMQKGSSNREKQRIKVAKLYEKVANQRKDFLHKQSRRIVNSCDCVCIEDLNMKAMAQALNFGKSVMDNGWDLILCIIDVIITLWKIIIN